MRCAQLRAEAPTIARAEGVVLLITVIAIAGAGFGCTAARPARSVTSPAATQPVSSQVTTEGLDAQIQAQMAQRTAVMDELKALDARIMEESGSSKTAIDSAKVQIMQAQRRALAAKLDALDSSTLTPESVAADPAIASGVSPDNPSAPRKDALGKTPEDAVMLLIDQLAKRNWAKAYSLYATPTPNAEMAAKSWSEADKRYADFTVRETRVADSERAWVRVTYKVTTDFSGGSANLVTVEDPGEWWPLHKVDGLWKVGWRP